MSGIHTRELDGQFLLNLPDTADEGRNRCEAFLNGVVVAPAAEIPVSLVDGDVLHTSIRNG